MFEATTNAGECSFCSSSAAPAFINGSRDALERYNRICPACLASITLLIDLAPVEQVQEERARANQLTAELKQRGIELEAERTQLTATTAALERTEADLESARSQSSNVQSALIAERKRADEAERGIPSLIAIRSLIVEGQESKTKTTNRKRATANV